MKSFRAWIDESTNCSAGLGVRGLGDVTGTPAGDISNYAAANSNDTTFANQVKSAMSVTGIGDSGDQKNNQLGWHKSRGKK